MLQTRPPIIAVLGHVDHGKTSLLDAIRHTTIQLSETGGITQHIGAYQIKYADRLLTFIDTPGHAAFTTMRERGGQAADIAILVVAADDGVMPQTKESINLLNTAGTPFIVAINKVDLPQADSQKIRAQLAEAGVLVEGFGGNVPAVEISAKKNLNLDKLLENLILFAELEELTADPDGHLEALIIESSLDRFKGPVATAIVKNGTLKAGDKITTVKHGSDKIITGRVKSLITWPNDSLTEAVPASPVQILGFDSVPPVGAVITHPGEEDQVSATALTSKTTSAANETKKTLSIILKTDVVGTLEAIEKTLPQEVEILLADTGPINESDVMLLSGVDHTQIVGFRVAPTPSAKKLASIENVKINTYTTIYDLLDTLKEQLATDEAARIKETITGTAKVLKIFDINNQKVVGATVISGSFQNGDKIHLKRSASNLGDATISSLRIGRETLSKVKKDQEFGAIFDTDLDFALGDDILGYKYV